MPLFKNTGTFIRNSLPVRLFVLIAKKIKLPGTRGLSVYGAFTSVRDQVKNDNILERAHAIAFNFTMAVPPTLIFLCSLVPYLPISHDFKEQIRLLLQNLRPIVTSDSDYKAIVMFVTNFFNHPRNDLLSIGFLLSLFFSSNAMMGVMRSFDKDFPGFKKRKGLQKRGAAIKLTAVLLFIFIICIALMVAQGKVLTWLGMHKGFWRSLIINTRWILIVLLFFTVISYIYKMAPSVDKRWKLLTPGSVFATIFTIAGFLGFSWWVSNFGNYNKLYGSIGTLLVIMILIFINSLILLLGFELNVAVYSRSHTYLKK